VGFLQAGNLKDLSAEDLDLLQKEIRTLKRGVRAELQARQRIGDCLQGFKYCCPWHRYLDTHRGSPPMSRLQFECKRALHRLKLLRRPAAGNATDAAQAAAGMPAALRSLKIRGILKEFRSITGEALKSSLRSLRSSGAPGA
jgi:hypothetical protein